MDVLYNQIKYNYYDLNLAGIILTAAFQFKDTSLHFGKYCLGASKKQNGIKVPKYELEIWKDFGLEKNAWHEYSCFTAIASDTLSQFNRFIVHAVAFAWKDKAYLIAAPSGVGKSTMIRTLQELYPGEFSIICGDRPILSAEEDGSLIVHPSPWNGKEDWHGAGKKELAGFINLSRGEVTRLHKMTDKEAALPVYMSIIQTRETEELIHRFSSFAEAVIKKAPVWNFISGGVPDSAGFLYDQLFKQEDLP